MVTRVEHEVVDPHTVREAPVSFDQLYESQWWPMLRLATGLVDQASVAEDVAQDAFAALHRKWAGIREHAAAVGYLRTSVVNGSRSVLRKRLTSRKYLRVAGEETVEAADSTVVLSAEYEMVRSALGMLPDRQREVLTLRYVAELSDEDIATATGLSLSGVRSASSRGLAALRSVLGGRL